ncbi:MAG TPA: phosphoribosyl-ATP diphosphatase [Clostridiales bacterium]|nr:phosphoribosyl-ATP diphosphatase [Clostridiales bacterium]
MSDILLKLYNIIKDRQQNPAENSYTCYLFNQGLDKILKKCGEECSEVIIAAKNGKQEQTVYEISDLLYHLTVLMVYQNIPFEAVFEELSNRSAKLGNLKQFHQVDKNT